MVYLEWPLIQGLMGLSSYFLHKFGAHKPVPYTIPYRSFAVPIEHLFDNVATRNFDGSGCHYPIELLPTGVLNSENVNVCAQTQWPFMFLYPDFSSPFPDGATATMIMSYLMVKFSTIRLETFASFTFSMLVIGSMVSHSSFSIWRYA